MRSGRTSWWCALTLAVASTSGSLSTAGQEVRPFALTGLGGHLELRVLREWERRDREGEDLSWASDETEYREGLRLDFEGYVYHPRLLEFSVGSLTELLQEESAITGGSSVRTSDALLSGDFGLDFLKEHPYGIRLYGARQEVDVDRFFAEDYSVTSDTLGALFRFQRGPLPLSAHYARHITKGTDEGRATNEVRDDFDLRGHYRIGTQSQGDLQYNWERVRENTLDRQFTLHQLHLTNTVVAGSREQFQLLSSLQASDRGGVADATRFTARENLTWRHAENLSTRYRLAYADNRIEEQQVETWDMGVSLSHRLFESLGTNLDVDTQLQEDTSGELSDYRVRLSETYSKRVGRKGTLGIGLRLSYQVLDRDPSSDTAFQYDEAHVAEPGIPIQLAGRNIITESVRVTDEYNIRQYSRLLDYSLLVRGDVVDLIVRASGDIPRGATILVDYEIETPGAGRVDSRGGGMDVSYSYGELLHVYARYAKEKQHQVTGMPLSRLESTTLQVYGVRLKWRWLSLETEYRDEASVYSPQGSLAHRLGMVWFPFSGWMLQMDATYQHTRFPDTGRRLDSTGLYCLMNGRVTQRGMLEFEADYRRQRWENFDQANDLDAYGVSLAFIIRYERLILDTRVRYSMLEQQGEREERGKFELSLRREF